MRFLTSRISWKLIALPIFALLFGACSSAEGPLAEGDAAPEFNLPSAQGGTVSLADYRDNQPVLLYFHMAVG